MYKILKRKYEKHKLMLRVSSMNLEKVTSCEEDSHRTICFVKALL